MTTRNMAKWCYDMGYSVYEARDRIKKAGHPDVTIQQVEELYEQEAEADWVGDEARDSSE